MAEGNISEMVNQLLKDEVPPRCIESNTNRDYESCDDISSSSELPRSRRPRIYGKRAIKTKKRIRKRLIKISEMSENPSEYSDISSVNPISEDSDYWPTIKSYDLPLSECNPNLYVDKEQHYKTAYLNEVEKNERLSLQIEELQQNRSLSDQMFENIHSQISLIPEEFKKIRSLISQGNEIEQRKEEIERLKKENFLLKKAVYLCRKGYAGLVTKIRETIQCPISFDYIKDPVITPSGITYDRSFLSVDISNRSKDPVTNQPMTLNEITPNRMVKNIQLCMKEVFSSLRKEEEIINKKFFSDIKLSEFIRTCK
ncbi:unnamed protein product [Moneuplotes crassus]|uniref:RING-type E3 ubiquitin transferase n=1 Tax=Euplotes crassus TaxID=5936 RepID=A0AAD1XCJ4_EUPCR|nr:unnamed protein product [Moneuplotes crassus]